MKTTNTKRSELERELKYIFLGIYPDHQIDEAVNDAMRAYSLVGKGAINKQNKF